MKDTKTILLALLSLGLVATWVYHLYDKTKYSNTTPLAESKEPALSIKKLQDSLQTVYTFAVERLGAQLDSVKNTAGLLQGELAAKLNEINMLRTEIADLLKKNNAKKEDMDLAGRKTTKLQELMAGLPKKNSNIPEEPKPVALVSTENNNPEIKPGIDPAETTTTPALFTASDLKFIPLKITDDKEEETNEAEDASKLLISFAVKNNTTGFNKAEVFAIITQPDGKVMQTDLWETATIDTRNFGKRPYTRKVKFEYQKGETKLLQLTLKPEDYEKGNYRLQVFHNGYLIGETVKRLN